MPIFIFTKERRKCKMCKLKFTDKMLISLKCTMIQECMNSDYVYFDFFGENRPDDDQEDLYAKVEETLEQMPEDELMKFYKEYVNSSGKEMN
jgi:hypothetical protein